MIFVTTYSFAQINYVRGFNNGYKKGYCFDQGVGCLAPIPPIAPIPKIGESLDSYNDGYNRGFAMGKEAQKNNKQTTNQTRERYQTSKSEFIEDNIYNPLKNVDINDVLALAQALRESKGLALEYLKNENYQAVANICYSGLKINPNDDEFMLLLGQAYRLSGDSKNGLKWLKKASRKRPLDKNLKTLIKNLKTQIKNMEQ